MLQRMIKAHAITLNCKVFFFFIFKHIVIVISYYSVVVVTCKKKNWKFQTHTCQFQGLYGIDESVEEDPL